MKRTFSSFVFLGIIVCILATKNPCPLHWAYYDGNCFFFSLHHAENWMDAQLICKEMNNSHLVTIDSMGKNDFIQGILSVISGEQRVHWTGGSDKLSEGVWTWVENGNQIGPYTNWGIGYPRNDTAYHDCLVTNVDDGSLIWRDRKCTTAYNYICEHRVGNLDKIVIGKRKTL